MERDQISVHFYVVYSLCFKIPLILLGILTSQGLWGEILAILNLIEGAYLLGRQQHLITACKPNIGKGCAVNLIAQILYKLRYVLDTHLSGCGQGRNMTKLLPLS